MLFEVQYGKVSGAFAPLLVGALLSGCGKTAIPVVRSGGLNPVAPVASAGAAGQITKNTTRLGGLDPVEDAAAVAVAVHPSGQPPETAVVVNKEELGVALAATLLTGPPLDGALLYGERGAVPAPTEAALKALRPRGSKALEGAAVLTVGGAAAPRTYPARSVNGENEAATAVSLARVEAALAATQPTHLLVVDPGQEPAFALPAASLAAAFGAPILLTAANRVPAATSSYLRTLNHPTVYLFGPPRVVGERVARELSRYGTVKRLGGETAAEEAIAVARFGEGGFGFGIQEPGHGLAFVDSRQPLDGPAAAPLATAGDFAPILILEGPENLPNALAGYLEDIRGAYSNQVPPERSLYNHGWIIGGAAAVSLPLQDRLDELLELAKRPTGTPSPAYLP